MSMTKAERGTLRAIVRAELKARRAEVRQRQREVEEIVRANLLAEEAALVGPFAKRRAKLDAQTKALADDARAAGLVDRYDGFEPEDLRARVNDEVRRLKAEAGSGLLNLEQLERDLVTELLVGELESLEARDFLSRIPSVDDVLPLPEGVAR